MRSVGLLNCIYRWSPLSARRNPIKFHHLINSIQNTSRSTIKLQLRKFSSEMPEFKYPQVQRDSKETHEAFGLKYTDAYRWLEDADSAETKKFVEEQNNISVPFITSCKSRGKIFNRLKEMYEYHRYGVGFKEGDNYFMYHNTGLQNQNVLYIMRGSLNAEQEVFFDPNTLSEDGTVALSTQAFSFDGKMFAYGLSKSGSDWITIKVRNVDTGADLNDEITKVKFSGIAWTHDNKGFFYSCYPSSKQCQGTETNECVFQKLYYHRLGTAQSEDVLIYENPEKPNYRFYAKVSDCGKYLHVMINQSCEFNLWYFHKFDDPLNPKITGKLNLEPVVEDFVADIDYVTNIGDDQYIHTNKDAPNFKFVKVNLASKEKTFVDIIPNHKKDVLEGVFAARKDLVVCLYIRDVISFLEFRKLTDGSLVRQLDLPVGSVSLVRSKSRHDELFFKFTSFLIPDIVYHMKLDQDLKNNPTIFRESKPKNFDSSKYVTKQVFFTSADGTLVPMFVCHAKNFVPNGSSPCLLYGYGGFQISITPYFSVQRLIMMTNLNGVCALANIRGGSEYGKQWHDNGKLFNKQNCFDDFISAAEYLVKEGYTSKDKLIIQGGSNGGLLVGAVANQRPDLFGAVLCHVGVMDLLRFHKFTIGHAWTSEYGNPDEEAHFRNLIRLSPLHNIPESAKKYPAMLLLTELQNKLGKKLPNTPLMIRIDTKAGHGCGKPMEKVIEEISDTYSFVINSLSLSYTD